MNERNFFSPEMTTENLIEQPKLRMPLKCVSCPKANLAVQSLMAIHDNLTERTDVVYSDNINSLTIDSEEGEILIEDEDEIEEIMTKGRHLIASEIDDMDKLQAESQKWMDKHSKRCSGPHKVNTKSPSGKSVTMTICDSTYRPKNEHMECSYVEFEN